MDAELFLASACELLAIPSTSEQPGELRRALDYVLDYVLEFAGPGFTVERFESAASRAPWSTRVMEASGSASS